MSKKKTEGEGLNKSFVRSCEMAFEPIFEDETEDQLRGMIENPFYERQMVEQFERGLEFAS